MSAKKFNLFNAIDFLIKIEQGPDKGKAFKIKPPQITLGRDPSCQVTLLDPKCSRQQLKILFKDNVICQDLSSKKTTRINGNPCHNTVLRPGDKISFGQTVILFETRTNQKAQPQLQASPEQLAAQKEKQTSKKNLRIFLFSIIALVFAYILLEEPATTKKEEKLATKEQLMEQIQETKDHNRLLRERYKTKRKLTQDDYLHNVEMHFISGFRDYQNGKYGRAINSFGTTIATDKDHERAARYAKSARKKRDDLIDTHLTDGQKYKEKMMYNRCAAEFEKAMVYINDANSERYRLAKEQYDQCRILKSGGYR